MAEYGTPEEHERDAGRLSWDAERAAESDTPEKALGLGLAAIAEALIAVSQRLAAASRGVGGEERNE